MQIVCPHCRTSVELTPSDPRQEVACPSCGSSFAVVEGRTIQEPTEAYQNQFGRFTLVGQLGAGSFGVVYRALDPQLNRTVAIKVPRGGGLPDGHDKERFLREARHAAQLRHPNIVSIHEIGEVNQTPYIVSDFVEGLTLADLLTSRRLTCAEAVEMIRQTADALQHAHAHGVIHRDVKPSNIMLTATGDRLSVTRSRMPRADRRWPSDSWTSALPSGRRARPR